MLDHLVVAEDDYILPVLALRHYLQHRGFARGLTGGMGECGEMVDGCVICDNQWKDALVAKTLTKHVIGATSGNYRRNPGFSS